MDFRTEFMSISALVSAPIIPYQPMLLSPQRMKCDGVVSELTICCHAIILLL